MVSLAEAEGDILPLYFNIIIVSSGAEDRHIYCSLQKIWVPKV